MLLKLSTKNTLVTDAMHEAALEAFQFLNEDSEGNLRITLERLNNHTLKIKTIYQQPHLQTAKVELICEDYYVGLEESAKKMKWQLQKLRQKRCSHDKLGLGHAFALSISEPQHEPTDSDISAELNVPIYTMTLEEAVEQINLFQYNVMLFQTNDDATLHALVRQTDGSLKHYVGLLV